MAVDSYFELEAIRSKTVQAVGNRSWPATAEASLSQLIRIKSGATRSDTVIAEKVSEVEGVKIMQTAAGLLAALGDCIAELKSHLATMEADALRELRQALPSRLPPGTAQMLMLILVNRELELRRHHHDSNVLPLAHNVLPFPRQQTLQQGREPYPI